MPTLGVPDAHPAPEFPDSSNGVHDLTSGPDTHASASSILAPRRNTSAAQWQIVLLPVDRISTSPYQTRVVFDPEELEDLTRSVRAQGVQQPVLVRTAKADTLSVDGKKPRSLYELVAGERRWRACQAAGRKTVPAIVRDDLSDAEAAELCLLENVQRANLSPIEEARGYRRLMLEFRLKEERLSKKVGKSVPAIRELLKLLLLPETVQDLLARKKLTASHGYELLKFASAPDICLSVALYAEQHKVTAAALARELLPNARELKKRGLVAELGFGTKFEWRTICQECPHKALVASGYASYCLRPDEWKRKQLEAAALEQDEQARVLEEARRSFAPESPVQGPPQGEEGELVDAALANPLDLPCLSKLKSGSYRNLSWSERPAGCNGSCPCRGAARDPHDAEKIIPLCLDPERYQNLVREERQRQDEERQRLATDRCERALALLQEQWQCGDFSRSLALMLLPFLDGRIVGGYMEGGRFENLVRGVGTFLGVELPWDDIFGEDTDETALMELLMANRSSSSTVDAPENGDDAELSPRAEYSSTYHPLWSITLAAGLLLALESQSAARWGGGTPLLDSVLGADMTEGEAQMELKMPEAPADDDSDPDESGERRFSGEEPPYISEPEADAPHDVFADEPAHDDLGADFPAREPATSC